MLAALIVSEKKAVREINLTIIQLITLSIALVGATLGIINTWHALSRDKVKLRVVPKIATPVGYGVPDVNFCIEVVNLSSFSVYIDEAGVLFSGTSQRGAIINPIFAKRNNNEEGWPLKLEPRESTTVYAKLDGDITERKIESVYVTTQCGIQKAVKSKIIHSYFQ
jgi:hypothetical protein